MPLPDEDAYRRISAATRGYERTVKSQSKRGRRFRDLSVPPATEFIGTVAATSPSLTATVTKLRQGADPRSDPSDPLEQVPIVAELGVSPDVGDEVDVRQNDDGTYSAFPRGGEAGPPGASGGSDLYTFGLEEDKASSVQQVKAILTDRNGDPINVVTEKFSVADDTARRALVDGTDPGEVEANDLILQDSDTSIWRYEGGGPSSNDNWTDLGPKEGKAVVTDVTREVGNDSPAGFFGLTDYVDADGTAQRRYRGVCYDTGLIVSVSVSGGSENRRLYQIAWMEGPATHLLGQIKEAGAASKPDYDFEITDASGSNSSTRYPAETGSGEFKIKDPLGLLEQAALDDYVSVYFDLGSGEYRPASKNGSPSGTGIAVVAGNINGMTSSIDVDDLPGLPSGHIEFASGPAFLLTEDSQNPGQYVATGSQITLTNATTSFIRKGKIVQYKTYAGLKVIDAEDCG